MSDTPYTVGKVEFSPVRSDKFYIEDEDPGICTACGLKMTPVRPGKAQCDYCELVEGYDKAQAEIRQLTAERDLIIRQRNIAYGIKNIAPYPNWICKTCGDKFGRGMPEGHVPTWHIEKCDICNEEVEVTEPRDFRHMKKWPIEDK